MTSKVVLPFIILIMVIVKAEGAELKILQHNQTKRFLDAGGTALANLTDIHPSEIMFYSVDIGFSHQKLLIINYNKYDYLASAQQIRTRRLIALGIFQGCRQSSSVRVEDMTGLPSQKWYFNSDGSITSLCDANWRLTVDKSGNQYARDVNDIPKDETIFHTVPLSEIK